jgi:hypothetical protein
MAQEGAPPVGLYDFLYRDSNRLTSYYAQIFEGRLASIEELEQNTESSQKKGGASIQVVSGEYQKTNQDQVSSKRTFDPHDMSVTDVLSHLTDGQFIHTDYASAPNSSLILAKGNLFFVDKNLVSSASSIYTSMVASGTIENDPNAAMGVQLLQNMLRDVPFPPLFILETEEDLIVTGTVKESGMEEPVSTHYFKYGSSGLPDVYLIGLKEIAIQPNPSSISQFMAGMQMVTQMLTGLLFPVTSIKTTPLALFRKFQSFEA